MKSTLSFARILLIGLLFLVLGFDLPCTAADDMAEGTRFAKEVQPILAAHCFKCHSHASGKSSGGLVVDSREALLNGGDTGPAIVPGKPNESLLVRAIRHDPQAEYQMPPKKKMSDAEIATLTEWVQRGAFWPTTKDDGKRKLRPRGQISDEDRQWWAFQPIKPAAPPAIKDAPRDWTANPIDRFILAKLREQGLSPNPPADPRALIRRLTFDLIGLPPSPEEVTSFHESYTTHETEKSYGALVDRLLEDQRYGERWARHWLDLVRYADSDGFRIDDYRPHAWRYRDYVVQAFNLDKPYDRFVQEQLAGDELFPGDPAALIATGYLRHWIYEYNARDVRGQWTNILNDITDTTGDVFLGLGIQCARCHDHKFDPILQKDYFRLQAFFAAIDPRHDLIAATDSERREYAVKLEPWEKKTAEIRRELEALEAKYREKAEKSAVEKFPPDIQAMIRKPVAERLPLEQQLADLAYRQVYYEWDRIERLVKGDDKEKLLALRRQLAEQDALKPKPLPVAFGATDVGPVASPVTIPKRGAEPIPPGFLTLLDAEPANINALPDSTGRRAALATWLTRRDNPLTARVIVNRAWQQHFGRGLAANSSDFGHLGDLPSHPELLDWLADRFMSDGWSLKKLHRLILTSATYRQSSQLSAINDQLSSKSPNLQIPNPKLIDPENRLYWRASTRRLDAEQIRDSLFAVTGDLKAAAGGPGSDPNDSRRSIYTKIMRNSRDPLLDVFDTPFWFQSASSRDTTTTPVQSLLLFNSQFMLQRAKAFAGRLQREVPNGDSGQLVRRAYELAFGRTASDLELQAATKFLGQQPAAINPQLAGSAQAAFVAGKIPYRDGQAADIALTNAAQRFQVSCREQSPRSDFTIEAFVMLRSVSDGGTVRTIAATGEAGKEPAWAFGVTGKKSRRKPQTLVMQLFGKKLDGTVGEEAIFSDQHIQLNRPYYLAAAVKLAEGAAADGRDARPGEITFFVKDLSNDDEPLLTAKIPQRLTGGFENERALTIGGRNEKNDGSFDGLIDDVRLSRGALNTGQLLFTNEGTSQQTIGYWLFESKPDVFHDASGHGLHIQPARISGGGKVDTHTAALIDFCHVLLNANEFLYVE